MQVHVLIGRPLKLFVHLALSTLRPFQSNSLFYLSLRTLCVVTFVTIVVVPCYPQYPATPNLITGNETTGPQPFTTGTSDTEQVNYSNGNVTIHVPLLQLPGINGPGYSLSVNYSSKNWSLVSSFNPYGGTQGSTGPSGQYSAGWQALNYIDDFAGGTLSIPRLGYSIAFVGMVDDSTIGGGDSINAEFAKVRWIYLDEDGATHSFPIARDIAPTLVGATSPIAQVDKADSLDQSRLTLDTSNGSDVTVTDANGRVTHFSINAIGEPDIGGGGSATAVWYYPTKTVDPNGNTTTYTQSVVGDSLITTVTDPLGHQINISFSQITYGDPKSPTIITASGASSSSGSPDVTLHATGCRQQGAPSSITDLTDDFGAATFSNTISIATGQGTRTYQVIQDAVYEPVEVIYPAGGYTSYSYASFSEGDYGVVGEGAYCQQIDGRQVVSKSVCRSSNGNCSSPELTSYLPTPFESSAYLNTSETITYPPDSRGVSTTEDLTFGQYSTSSPIPGQSQSWPTTISDVISDLNGVQKTTSYTYDRTPPGASASSYCPEQVGSVTVQMAGSANTAITMITPDVYTVSDHYVTTSPLTATCYDSQQALTQSYDLNNSLLKTVSTQWDKTDSFVSADHLFTRVSSRTVTDNVHGLTSTESFTYDANGNILGETLSASGVNAPLVSSYISNSHGQITSYTDPRGFQTTYGYDNPYSDANCSINSSYSPGPTSITDPLGHRSTTLYYSCNGLPQSDTDPNKNSTTFSYDLIGRLQSSTYPDGGGATLTSGDTAPIVNARKIKQDASGQSVESAETEDGIGDLIQMNLAYGQSIVDTVFDALGNVSSKSNPYSSTSGASSLATRYYYDALARVIVETETDGNSKQWCYNGSKVFSQQQNCNPEGGYVRTGSWVDYQDESGSRRQYSYDALGHLVKVLEPDSSGNLNVETDYQNDGLGNVWRVDQWGGAYGNSGDLVRQFTYDGLSRLLNSSNPESGTTSYGYSTAGSLCSGDSKQICNKTDARGIITTYAYDAIDRLTSKGFSDGSPSACYSYDVAGNGVGRLSVEWTLNGACGNSAPSPGSVLTQKSIMSYDPMGRVWNVQQCVSSTCTGQTSVGPPCAGGVPSPPYYLLYCYDLAGNLSWSTNGLTTTPGPNAPLAFSYAYDSANHLNSITSNYVDAYHPENLFSAPSYSAAGSLTGATYGANLSLTRTYDNRLRITGEIDTGTTVQGAKPSTGTVTITGSEQSQ